MAEAVQTAERLLDEESERLRSARKDVVGRQMQDYVFSMLMAELVRVTLTESRRPPQSSQPLPGAVPENGTRLLFAYRAPGFLS